MKKQQNESYRIHYKLNGADECMDICTEPTPRALSAQETRDFLVRSLKSEINYKSANDTLTDIKVEGIDM